MSPIDETLLDMLVCPKTLTPLRHVAADGVLVSDEAGLAYPVRDGIPILLVEEAIPLTPGTP
jgi:hypothetical protein